MTENDRRTILKAVLVALRSIAGMAGCKPSTSSIAMCYSMPAPGVGEEERTLKRAELVERLQKLAESESPKDLSLGAFCYRVGAREIKKIPCRECKRTMIVGEMDEILNEYKVPLKRIQDQGVHAALFVPEHCPQCGYGLKKAKFFLEIKYLDRPDFTRVKLKNALELEIMVLFLQGQDRYDAGFGSEKALKKMLPRLKKLFGIEEKK